MVSALASILGVNTTCVVTDFARAIHGTNHTRIRSAPVFALESFRIVDMGDHLIQLSMGTFGHQFLLVTIRIKTDQYPNGMSTYARVDFSPGSFEGHPIAQTVRLSDDHEVLRGGARGLGRLAIGGQPPHTGPSLDAFGSLLEIVHGRTHHYDVFSQNCLWLTETLLLATARKFSQHWLDGFIFPDALKRYTRWECDEVTCATELSIDGPVARWFGDISTRALRATQAFFTASAPDRLEMHHEDIRLVNEAWNPEIKGDDDCTFYWK